MALSGRQAGSTVTGKDLSAASFSWYSRLSIGSSVVQITFTLLMRISPRAEYPSLCSFAFAIFHTSGAVFSFRIPSYPKKRRSSRWLQWYSGLPTARPSTVAYFRNFS